MEQNQRMPNHVLAGNSIASFPQGTTTLANSSLDAGVQTSYVLCLDAERALTAEDVRAQKFITEFAVRVELFA